ncbi:hypothetical protein Taro_004723 [Colocasia esculenta]|uniref:Uncharacterized protein n=1 Tax=Colocasia esculenta TaxID=4460 RepID=A0A843TSE5_COLES|nr:hypothetical protein [Colocasia esculenta]
MERHKPIPQPFFPSYNRTPKHHGYLNTLHQTLGTSFRTCWGRVEEFLVARELWIDHKKLIFFPIHLLQPAQTIILAVLDRNPRTYPFSVDARRRPCEGDGSIGRVLRSCHDSTHRHVLKATKRSVATFLPDLTAPSRSSHHPVAFWFRPVTTLTGVYRDLTLGLTALSLSLYFIWDRYEI